MTTLIEKIEILEKAEIEAALRKSGWVKARAARMLGITERMIGYKVKKYGLERGVTAAKEEAAMQKEPSSRAQQKNFGIQKEER